MKFIEPPVDTDYLIDFILFIVNTKREEGDLAVRKQLNESKEQITSIINSLKEDNIAIFINKIQSQFKEIPELDSDLTGYHNNEYLQSTLLDLQTFILTIKVDESLILSNSEVNKVSEEPSKKSIVKQATAQQIVIFFEYLFNHIDNSDINNSERSRIITELTGIGNQKIRSKHSSKSKDNYDSDLQKVHLWFQKLKFYDIASKVTQEIDNKRKL